MAGLMGAMSRMLGQSPPSYRERDDVAAGLLIREQMKPDYQRRKQADEAWLAMFMAGLE